MPGSGHAAEFTHEPGVAAAREGLGVDAKPTMNVNDEIYVERGFQDTLVSFAEMMGHTLSSCELLTLTNTVLFDDYSKYVYLMPDIAEKSIRVEKISAENLNKAFDLGVRLIKS